MSDKAKYILCSILDFGLTFGGTGAVIIYNFVSPDTSNGFKLSFAGIVLIIALVFSCKAIFEHTYQNKMNDLLRDLSVATTIGVKEQVQSQITKLKVENEIYQRLVTLLPFAILYVVSQLGINVLKELSDALELILASMGAGSVFNVIKKPLGENLNLNKIESKLNKNKK